MKKILLGVLLFVAFLFVVPGKVSAECFPNSCATASQMHNCSYEGANYCCSNATDCDDFKDDGAINGSNASELWCVENESINTAIGCIPIGSQEGLLGFILRWAVGIGGGIAFVLMLYAGFMLMTASGNPERMKAGQELMTSALAGLILLIFSIFILRFIGVDILGLDKFGFGS